MLREYLVLAVIIGCVAGQFNPHFEEGSFGIVHLFEWHWNTIADECESFFGPNKIGGIQVSPPNENLIIDGRPWWERYQPISYILQTRSGDRDAFVDMVERCNNAGVRIYADIVINHMCGAGSEGEGTAGTSDFDSDPSNPSFPGIPYYASDFHLSDSCPSESGSIEDPQSALQVRNCMLFGLLDLNQGISTVRDTMVAYLNDLLSIGVAGFRIDAAKHMWPRDLRDIYRSLNDLNRDSFGPAQRAYIYQEVIDNSDLGEAGAVSEYTDYGSVIEFKYGIKLSEYKDSLVNLRHFTDGMITSTQALACVNNHDNQRGHGNAEVVVTFQDPYNLKILTAFMLAWPYGVTRVMSSYYFSDSDQGPPPNQRGLTPVGTCTNGWVCEHRWRPIKNMFAFGNAVKGLE